MVVIDFLALHRFKGQFPKSSMDRSKLERLDCAVKQSNSCYYSTAAFSAVKYCMNCKVHARARPRECRKPASPFWVISQELRGILICRSGTVLYKHRYICTCKIMNFVKSLKRQNDTDIVLYVVCLFRTCKNSAVKAPFPKGKTCQT